MCWETQNPNEKNRINIKVLIAEDTQNTSKKGRGQFSDRTEDYHIW